MVRVAVIGCGVLGIKIAGALAHDGHEVRVHDSNVQILNKVYLHLTADRQMLKEDGFLTNANFVGDVYCFGNLEEALRGTQFVFECIPEDLTIKRNLFNQLDLLCSDDVVLATSSMRLPVEDIFDEVTHKERCIGVRFLYPVHLIPEVELVTFRDTSLETLEKVRKFLESMGRVGFFRSGDEPVVLTEEQREIRRADFMRKRKRSLVGRRYVHRVPDLGSTMELPSQDNKEVSSLISHEKECVVCMDKPRDCVLHPCHHLCTCIHCGKLLLKRQDACPICRRTITNSFRVYHS
ncbi:Lambda-crystallin -like protein [Halotydeus destructor]|nr:Lambda-crystallin -like protein [Halotydeus destructor]